MKDFKMPSLTSDSYKPVIKSTNSEKSEQKKSLTNNIKFFSNHSFHSCKICICEV